MTLKVAVFSDLHVEINGLSPESFLYTGKNADVIVLAGDIVTRSTFHMLGAIRSLVPKHVPILYTPGNHDYYHDMSYPSGHNARMSSHRKFLRRYCKDNNIVFLDRDTFEYHGHLFIGATGWSDLQSYDHFLPEEKKRAASTGIADFHQIGGYMEGDGNEWTVENMLQQSEIDKHFLKKKLKTSYQSGLVPVMVTHFSPLEYLNNQRYPIRPMSSYFSNNWTELVGEVGNQGGTLIYGHTHGGHGVKIIDGALCISNMRGYQNECKDTYDPYMIIDIDMRENDA